MLACARSPVPAPSSALLSCNVWKVISSLPHCGHLSRMVAPSSACPGRAVCRAVRFCLRADGKAAGLDWVTISRLVYANVSMRSAGAQHTFCRDYSSALVTLHVRGSNARCGVKEISTIRAEEQGSNSRCHCYQPRGSWGG